MNSTLVWLNVSLLVGTVIAFIVIMRKVNLKQKGLWEMYEKKKYNNRYNLYSQNILSRTRFRGIVSKYATMACYDIDKVRKQSVDLFEKTMLVTIAMPVIAIVVFNNIVLAGLVGLIALVYYDMTVDRAMDKLYREISEECSTTIQSIKDQYKITNSIPEAVLTCERSSLIEEAVGKLYRIVSDVNRDEILEDFKKSAPVRILSTLATVLYISNDEGDSTLADGTSAFDQEMSALRDEVDSEVIRLMRLSNAFAAFDKLALVGIIVAPGIDFYLKSNIPGTSLYIDGIYGAVTKSIIVGLTIFAYQKVATLRRSSVATLNDKSGWIDSLSRKYKVKKFIQAIEPKKFRTRRKWDMRFKEALSVKTLDYVYTAKVAYSSLAVVLGIIGIIGFIITARVKLYNNYGSLAFTKSSEAMTEEYYETLVKMDAKYLAFPNMLDEDSTRDFVKQNYQGDDLKTEEQVKRLMTKYKNYKGLLFKWYYIPIVYAGALFAWFSQEMALKSRKKEVTMEEVVDVMQLQTLLVTLSNTSMGTKDVLYWMARESTIHKPQLHYAYVEFTSDPALALERLKDSVRSRDLKRLVSKLEKTILELSVHDAFCDVATDKKQAVLRNEIIQTEMINSRKESARLIMSTPLYATIFLGLIGPIGILGILQLFEVFTQLQS